MAELKTDRAWRVTVTPGPGDLWPDIRKPMSWPARAIRPATVCIGLGRYDDGPIRPYTAQVTGHKVYPGGATSTVPETVTYRLEAGAAHPAPEWVADIAGDARHHVAGLEASTDG